MGKTYVLDRVTADLTRGYTHPAIQRLSSLVAAYPHDLDLRRRLAAAYRRVGNRVQAGRWDYLTIGADANDTSAFEQAFPSAATRLRKVRWPHRANQAPTAYARTRLARLVEAAESERPPSGATPEQRSRPPRIRFLGRIWHFRPSYLVAGAVVAAPLAVLGAATVVDWIV